MTFSTGASHTGFTFPPLEWNAASGTIWIANLAGASTITKDVGTFDLKSFDIGTPVAGVNMIELTSDVGDTLVYDESVVTTHNVSWAGVTTLKFERVSGSGATADIDNIVYCELPSLPTTIIGDTVICTGDTTTLVVSGGSLNGASNWYWYSGSCGGTAAGTGTSINAFPSVTTSYFVRPEGGCEPVPNTCFSVTIQVDQIPATPNVLLNPAGDSLISSILGDSYNWYFAGNLQPGQSNYGIPFPSAGVVQVEVISGTCTSASSPDFVVENINENFHRRPKVFPNPSSGFFTIEMRGVGNSGNKLSIYNSRGQLVPHQLTEVGPDRIDLDLSGEPSGLYLIHQHGRPISRIVIQ